VTVQDVARLVRRRLRGRTLDLGADADIVLAEWTDDGAAPGQLIAPPHTHLEDDEAWYVLEGRLQFRIGDEEIDAPAGTAVYGLHGLAHTYWNPDPTPARYLLVMRPRTVRLIDALHDGTDRDRSALEALFREHAMELNR
jgi:mannose-6-phosphate isomerase-like protein (cupin superfamily)